MKLNRVGLLKKELLNTQELIVCNKNTNREPTAACTGEQIWLTYGGALGVLMEKLQPGPQICPKLTVGQTGGI